MNPKLNLISTQANLFPPGPSSGSLVVEDNVRKPDVGGGDMEEIHLGWQVLATSLLLLILPHSFIFHLPLLHSASSRVDKLWKHGKTVTI